MEFDTATLQEICGGGPNENYLVGQNETIEITKTECLKNYSEQKAFWFLILLLWVNDVNKFSQRGSGPVPPQQTESCNESGHCGVIFFH